ncbi:MAG TPA: discoidin domain-containing protein, partial [Flavisolibacter sp.]|nr:discoidin domain-containing protein [Flavisolibacter sp.]
NKKVDVEMYRDQPLVIKKSVRVEAFASRDKTFSPVVAQRFYKIPSDKSITVLSKVHLMYTAGGPEALIDSIQGNENWRTGEWQSYYNQDFEAIVDLQKTKPVNHLGIHVLQDVSPWIMYPKEVIFYTSNDGINFTEAIRIQNEVAQEMGSAQTQELGANVNLQTRYIKVKAVNGGTLPAWHESAGNPSHIFIDEIIIR